MRKKSKFNFKKVRLTKLSDDAFNGNHPNGIYDGFVIEGQELVPMVVGERYYVNSKRFYGFSTSLVTSIPDEKGVFKTMYSTYKLEYL